MYVSKYVLYVCMYACMCVCVSQGALMFAVQSGDLNTVTTLNLGCCNVAERNTSYTQQWHSAGNAVSTGVGNKWACRSCLPLCVCGCVCGGKVRQR